MKKYINELVKTFYDDVHYYENDVTDKEFYYFDIIDGIKKDTKLYFETDDEKIKKEIINDLERKYNMLFYINALKDVNAMYNLPNEIELLPNIYLVDQKPERFEIDEDLLTTNIDVSQGLTEDEAIELLKWTSNNTRDNLNISNKMRNSSADVYDNDSLGGSCGFSQFSTLYPLKQLGLKVTINNIGEIGEGRHAYGTVIIPIKKGNEIVNKRYLIDCTYRQFFTVPNNIISRYLNTRPEIGFYIVNDSEEVIFAKELMKNGFIEATDENLKKYLKPFFSMKFDIEGLSKVDKEFLKIDIIDIIDNKQDEWDYTEEEFNNWGMNLSIINKKKSNNL